MESDLQHHHHFLHDRQLQHHQKQLNSGLTRYQSAPSSHFSSFLDRDFCEDFLNRPTSPETERIFARFLSNTETEHAENMLERNLEIIRENSLVREKMTESEQKPQIIPPMNNQSGITEQQQQQRNYSSAPQNYYQNQQHKNLQNQVSGSEMDYRTMCSVGMDRFSQMKMSGCARNNSNLIRHSSSPAGLFNNIIIENGYVVMKGMGDFGTGNNSNRVSTAGRPPTSSKPMNPISEIGNKTNNAGFSETHSNNFSSGFPMDSWDESSLMSENIKRLREDNRTLSGLSASETQDIEAGNRPLLAHHLSLPKDITSIEKLSQFQDSVPCKIRAKRGCATHPRSIAERVRRTKISERMRKLQELVPNMDKQTNTADMLDLAVDYVKELQKQVKTLSDNQSKCTCSKEQPA